jgi:hypothetical protein
MIKHPGRQPTRAEQLFGNFACLVTKRSPEEVIIVHHVTEDTPKRLQMEVERRCPKHGLKFERIVL